MGFPKSKEEIQGALGAFKKGLRETITNASLAAGTNTISSTAVLASRIRKFNMVSFSYTGTVTGVRLEIKIAGVSVYKTIADPVSGQVYYLPKELTALIELWVNAAETLDLVITGATLGNSASLTVVGVEYSTFGEPS